MRGLTSDFQLTLPTILRRVKTLYGHRETPTRGPAQSLREQLRDYQTAKG